MITLYYSNAACSMSAHITLEELGLPYDAKRVNLTEAPSAEFLKVNPMGAVPAVIMENGQPLTEAAVILQYLADLKPEAGLAPRPGTLERIRLQEWLNFIATELHKGFGPLWHLDDFSDPKAREEARAMTVAMLGERFDVIVKKLGAQQFLMPSGFTIADAYLYTILNWANFVKLDLSRWPSIQAYMERVKARPAVLRTLKAEHLVQ